MRYQRTVRNIIECKGIGLHTGVYTNLKLSPAPPDTGYVFIRRDKDSIVKGTIDNVVATSYSSTIGFNGFQIQTVEHLLAALAGLNIDNIYIEIDSSEIPIMDGSSYPFVELIMDKGIVQQKKIRPHVKIMESIIVMEEDRYIRIDPSPCAGITYIMDFDHPLLSRQIFDYHYSIEDFVRNIAPARTFGFLKDIPILKEKGLGKGGSLKNVILLSDMDILNSEGLRYKDEFIRHKILDVIGDMALLPFSFIGHITAYRSGHNLNTKLASEILSREDKWTEATYTDNLLCKK